MIITSPAMDAIFTNFRADYEAGRLAAQPLKDRIAVTVTSANREETYGWLGNYHKLREWIGQRVVQNLVAHDFTIKNRDFENTVGVSRNDIEDDRIGIYSNVFQQMGQDAALHPDELVFELIRDGGKNLGYDGQPFFDNDHPVIPPDGTSKTVSNADLSSQDAAPTWVLLDTTKVVKPFIFQVRKDYQFITKDRGEDDNVFFEKQVLYGVDARANAGYGLWQLAYGSDKPLTKDNFAKARAAMMSLKAPTGKPLGITPDLLLVAPALDEAARELFNLDTSIYYQAIEWITTPWLG